MVAYLDTNVLVRHLVGEPPEQARSATACLEAADRLLLPDVVIAETIHVLRSFYAIDRRAVAWMLRAAIGFPAIAVRDAALLYRSLELYEQHRLSFPDAYLAASAEATGIGAVVSFDRGLDRVETVERIEPAAA